MGVTHPLNHHHTLYALLAEVKVWRQKMHPKVSALYGASSVSVATVAGDATGEPRERITELKTSQINCLLTSNRWHEYKYEMHRQMQYEMCTLTNHIKNL